jgi:mannitol-1-phosphate 5-dehydrogenase
MSVIVWGAGRIGRGFVAELLHEGGYFVDFVDKNRELADALNERGHYTIFKADENGVRKSRMRGFFRAHHTSDDLSALFLDDSCLIDVAVFKNDLEEAADMIAPYIALRAEKLPASNLDIITNVNMVSPEHVFRELLEKRLTGGAREYLDRRVGISGIFMMCISPDAPAEMLAEDPLAVYNNGFFEQALDASAFRGGAPIAPRLRLSNRLEAEEARKLYTLNMGHCALAYLGINKYATSYAAVQDGEICRALSGALDEAATGLEAEFGFTGEEMRQWKEIILSLLRNPYMADPLSRLGADSRRKLSGNDRLVMPARLCLKAGRSPMQLARIIRAGYAFENADPGTAYVQNLVNTRGLESAVCAVSGVEKGDKLFKMIIKED